MVGGRGGLPYQRLRHGQATDFKLARDRSRMLPVLCLSPPLPWVYGGGREFHAIQPELGLIILKVVFDLGLCLVGHSLSQLLPVSPMHFEAV